MVEKSRKHIHPIGVEIIKAQSPLGKRRLFDAIDASDGNALMVMHPFFAEATKMTNQRDPVYTQYRTDLRDTVTQHAGACIPVVLFEGEGQLPRIYNTALSLGMRDNEVFVAATYNGDPQLSGGESLYEFLTQMRDKGLRRTSVSGSYLWVYKESSPYFPRDIYTYTGCVGGLLTGLHNAGVKADISHAVYPPDVMFK